MAELHNDVTWESRDKFQQLSVENVWEISNVVKICQIAMQNNLSPCTRKWHQKRWCICKSSGCAGTQPAKPMAYNDWKVVSDSAPIICFWRTTKTLSRHY